MTSLRDREITKKYDMKAHSLPSLFKYPGSELKNPLIASVFYDIGWAEVKGTGLKTTIELLRKEGYPLPEYLNDTKTTLLL